MFGVDCAGVFSSARDGMLKDLLQSNDHTIQYCRCQRKHKRMIVAENVKEIHEFYPASLLVRAEMAFDFPFQAVRVRGWGRGNSLGTINGSLEGK